MIQNSPKEFQLQSQRGINVIVDKLTKGDKIMTLKNQSNLLYGTKVYNEETKSIGLLIYTWDNTFWSSEGPVDVPFATCVESKNLLF